MYQCNHSDPDTDGQKKALILLRCPIWVVEWHTSNCSWGKKVCLIRKWSSFQERQYIRGCGVCV